jgi:hypothetical protein
MIFESMSVATEINKTVTKLLFKFKQPRGLSHSYFNFLNILSKHSILLFLGFQNLKHAQSHKYNNTLA